MTEYPILQAILGDHQTGKTTELMRWLLAGHKIEGEPGWSRIIVVADHERRSWMIRHFRYVDITLRSRDEEVGLDGLLFVHSEHFWQSHAMDVEFAVDDLDYFLSRLFRGQLAVFTMTAEIRVPHPKGTIL